MMINFPHRSENSVDKFILIISSPLSDLNKKKVKRVCLFLMIYLFFRFSENHYDNEFDHLLKGKEIVVQADSVNIPGFTDQLVRFYPPSLLKHQIENAGASSH